MKLTTLYVFEATINILTFITLYSCWFPLRLAFYLIPKEFVGFWSADFAAMGCGSFIAFQFLLKVWQ
jgi:hypothetical protein